MSVAIASAIVIAISLRAEEPSVSVAKDIRYSVSLGPQVNAGTLFGC